ncbi:16083_t:CDS:1, partial [Gigaspora margarita]
IKRGTSFDFKVFILIGDFKKRYNMITQIYGNLFQMVDSKNHLVNIENCNSGKAKKIPLLVNEIAQKGMYYYFCSIHNNFFNKDLYFLLTEYKIEE